MQNPVGINHLIKIVIVFLFIMLQEIVVSVSAEARRAIPDDNLAYPVLVKIAESPIGSGFFVNTDRFSYFVTAQHVIIKKGSESPVSKEIEILSYGREPEDPTPNLIKLDLSYFVKAKSILIHHEFDVAVVPIGKNEGPSLNLMKGVTKVTTAKTGIIGVSIKNIKRLSDVLVANEVYVFAFPSSIGIRKSPRFEYNRPLLRKGVVSGKSLRLKSIVIDTSAFKGDSGGPVLEVEQEGFEYRYRLIGVITEFIPYIEEWYNRQLGYTNIEISNSGYSVVAPADIILDLISEFETK